MTHAITEQAPAPEAPGNDNPPETAPAPPTPPPKLRRLMGRYSGPRDLDGQLRLASNLATARLALPELYRGKPGDLLAVIQHAVALDIELMVAIDNLHFLERGQVGMRARLMHALVLRAGHAVELLHADDRKVAMRLVRGDGGPTANATWTLFEAQQAQLIKADPKSNWRAYPADMLWARCMSRVSRRGAPDATLGMHEIGELLDGAALEEDTAALEPVDLDSVVRDADGNPTPAPDVVSLLDGLDTAGSEEIRDRWRRASERGLLKVYGGTVEDVHHTVEEILFDAGTAAQEREARERKAGAGAGPRNAAPTAAAATPETTTEPDQPAGVEAAPAGQGERFDCGCHPAEVLAVGAHQPGCTRDGGAA